MANKNRNLHIDITAKDKSKKATDSVNRNLGTIEQKASLIGPAIAGAFSIAALERFASSLVKTNQEMERIQKRLDFSGESMAYVRGVTDRLGLSLQTTAEDFSKFAAATKGTSLEGDKTRLVFEAVAEASASMGLSIDQTQGAFRALEQMVSKGNVQAEELRGQLGERLPGAFNIAARGMGVTTKELNKMLELGQVTADEMLPKFAAELRKTYSGDAPRLTRALNEVGNEFFNLQTSIGTAGGNDGVASGLMIVRDLLRGTSVVVTSAPFQSGMQTFAETMDNVSWSIQRIASFAPSANSFLSQQLSIFATSLPGIREVLAFNAAIGALRSGEDQAGQRMPIPQRPTTVAQDGGTSGSVSQGGLDSSSISGAMDLQNFLIANQESHAALTEERMSFQAELERSEIEANDIMFSLREGFYAQQNEQEYQRYLSVKMLKEKELQDEIDLQNLKYQAMSNGTSAAMNLTNALYTFNGRKSKQLFDLNKAAGIANATVSTYVGAAKALASVAYPYNLFAAASVIAAGLAQVANISSQSFEGGGKSAAAGGTGAGTQTSPAVVQPTDISNSQQQSININIQGNLIGEDAWVENNLIPAINRAGNRNVTISSRSIA